MASPFDFDEVCPRCLRPFADTGHTFTFLTPDGKIVVSSFSCAATRKVSDVH